TERQPSFRLGDVLILPEIAFMSPQLQPSLCSSSAEPRRERLELPASVKNHPRRQRPHHPAARLLEPCPCRRRHLDLVTDDLDLSPEHQEQKTERRRHGDVAEHGPLVLALEKKRRVILDDQAIVEEGELQQAQDLEAAAQVPLEIHVTFTVGRNDVDDLALLAQSLYGLARVGSNSTVRPR